MASEKGKLIPVQVALRCRPLVPKEIAEGCQCCLTFVPSEPQVIVGTDKAFTFDYVFDPMTEQEEFFNTAILPLLAGFFKGYNATVLAYGQTGSGKTYSMGGAYTSSQENDPNVGVIPRVVQKIFKELEDWPKNEFSLAVSYLEIYNDQILDLLVTSQDKTLSVREDKDGIKVVGLTENPVLTADDMVGCLETGNSARSVGSTAMNAASSRSHAIFTIKLELHAAGENKSSAKLHLVDLAGSERQKKTKAQGDRLKEGISINSGLLCLGNVISALGDETKKGSFVPYRDSKLTRLLRDSLGGNSNTLMIACVSPADSNMEETISTLRYADRARKIKNKPVVNVDPMAAEMANLKKQVQELQVLLLHAQGGVAPEISGSGENVAKLMDRNRMLQDKNEELSKKLTEAAGETALMFEKIIMTEQTNEKLQNKLNELKQHEACKVDLEKVLECLEDEELKEKVEMMRNLQEVILELQRESAAIASSIEAMVSEDGPAEVSGDGTGRRESDEADFRNGIDSPSAASDPNNRESFTTLHALRQAQMSRELIDLHKVLSMKEQIAKKMSENDNCLGPSQSDHQKNIDSLQAEIDTLQKEKEGLMTLLNGKKDSTQNNHAKLSEQRRKRLQELEAQIGDMKKKILDQSKLLKIKEASVRNLSKLMQEIQAMKKQRVQLMTQMREESVKFRLWKSKTDKEMLKLKEKDRKRQYEIVKMERDFQAQANVLRRKTEEAAAANKRLKDALQKRSEVAEKRKRPHTSGEGAMERAKAWLLNEVEVLVSTAEAQRHLTDMLEERKSMAEEINILKQQADTGAQPVAKIRRRTLLISELENQEKLEAPVSKQLENLQAEMKLRNAQIATIQQKIVDADNEGRLKQFWDNITTMAEAKGAIKVLRSELVSAKVSSSKLESELIQEKRNVKDMTAILDGERQVMSKMDMEHQQQMMELEGRHQEVLCLLTELQNTPVPVHPASPERPDAADVKVDPERSRSEALERTEKERELLQRLQLLEEDIEELREQNETLKKENEKLKRKRKTVCTSKESKDLDDTPEKVISSMPLKCGCKSYCRNKMCSCRKSNALCGESCLCDYTKCKNRDTKESIEESDTIDSLPDDMVSIPQDPTAMNATFFKPPSCTPTIKVLKEGNLVNTTSFKLKKKPVILEEDREGEQENEEEEELEEEGDEKIIRKKKRLPFFSGCTPIWENV